MEEKKTFKEFLCEKKGGFLLTVAIYIIYFCLISFLGSISNGIEAALGDALGIFALILMVIWGYFGWRSLTFIQPSIFLIMPIAGWIIYFMIKGVASVIVGIFVLPYQIAKMIRNMLLKSM